MTQLEDELREYIRENLMSGTTLLLIKEVGIPILVEYLKRKDKKVAAKMVEEISKKYKLKPKVTFDPEENRESISRFDLMEI